jgi:hypothetical protein
VPLDWEGQHGARAAHDAREEAHIEDRSGQLGQIACARVVAGVDESRDGGEVGAAEAHLVGALVHHRDEAVLGAGDVLGEGDRGVVAGRKHEPV